MCLVVLHSLGPCGLQPSRLLCPWGFSRQEYWSGSLNPPLGDLANPGLQHCRQILLQLNHQESPRKLQWVGSLSFLQGIFLTQESNRCLLLCRWILYQLSYQGSPAGSLERYIILFVSSIICTYGSHVRTFFSFTSLCSL